MNDDLITTALDAFNNLKQKTEVISVELSKQLETITVKINDKNLINTDKLNDIMKNLGVNMQTKLDTIAVDATNPSTSNIVATTTEMRESMISSTLLNIEGLDKLTKELQDNWDGILSYISSSSTILTDLMPDFYNNINLSNKKLKTNSISFKKVIHDKTSISLKFEGINDRLLITGYSLEDINIKAFSILPYDLWKKALHLIDKNNKYGITIDNLDKIPISLSVEVPKIKLNSICLLPSNAKTVIDNLQCSYITIKGANTKVNLSRITCDSIKCDLSKGKIKLSDIRCEILYIKSALSPVSIDSIDCRVCDISTTDSEVDIKLVNDISIKSEFKIFTSNGEININLSLLNNTGVYIDASNCNGNININIPNISYSKNENDISGIRHIIGQNADYNTAGKTLKINVFTSNADINVE